MTEPRSAPHFEPAAADLEACRRGDRSALDRLLRAQAPRLLRVLGRLVGTGPDLEDVLQTTLLEAVRAFPRFRGEASVETWLVSIAVHTAHHYLRRPERRRRAALELVTAASSEPDPEHVLSSRRILLRLERHLGALGPKRRIAFVLHVLEGYTIAEVAALTGTSRVATKSRVLWARRSLSAAMRHDAELRPIVEAWRKGGIEP